MQIITRAKASIYNAKNREYYLDKFNHKCVKCDATEHLQLDHIIAITEGGDNSEENIQVLCKSCNLKKGGKRYSGDEHHTRKNPKKNKLKLYQTRLDDQLLNAIKISAAKNSEGNVNAEIRRLIRKGLTK